VKRAPIDWTAVEAAMRRSKEGRAQPGDGDLCGRAWRRAPKEYARRKRAVDEAVMQEERERWR
jgi:hypothetical protein